MMHLSLLGIIAGLIAIGLGVRLYVERRERNALRDWLARPQQVELPDGSGVWSQIFADLERRERSIQRDAAALQQVIERYRLATEVLPDGVVVLDGGDHIEWLNAAAADHLGIDAQRDQGTLIGQLLRQPAFQSYLSAFRREPQAHRDGLTLPAPDGLRTLRLELFRFSGRGTLLLTRDISDSVRTDQMRRDFIANVSHELRTPATVIYGFLEQMTGDDPPQGEDARRFLQLMAEQAQRMNRLVDDLLMLSRLENALRPPEDNPIDLSGLLATLADEGRALSGGRHTVDLDVTPGLQVRGSEEELRSAFGNLVSNAVRYTPEGGRICLRGALVEGQPEISVQDSGIGIAAEHIPRLTERFYRVDRGRSTATGGTGLGLAIVKHVLNRHNAVLRIESEPGKGSNFCIRLEADRRRTNRTAQSGA